ncbi:SMP-30/gluconolactonase/LRE family protein [Streptomyces albidoflavus]|uniref:SMP-30/gluconolactonase/LRE family protein n=1 Tax=Streptomyces albidoflavus TaxID=1886 RepID=UPI003862F02E
MTRSQPRTRPRPAEGAANRKERALTRHPTGAAGPPAFRPWSTHRRELGEGLRHTGNHLVTVDILDGTLTALDPATPGDGAVLLRLDVPLGVVAPLAGLPGHWLAAAGTGAAVIAPDGSLAWLDHPGAADPVRSRVNDGCCDPSGRFWFGTMPYGPERGAGRLHRVGHDGSVTTVLDGLTIPNGPAFTADGTLMYLADSAEGRIDRFRVDPEDGRLLDRTAFAAFAPGAGSPDGMTVDDDGQLWVAVWGAGAVHRYAPDGTLTAVLPLPAVQPTSPALVNGTLFVATAAIGLTPQPDDRPDETRPGGAPRHDGRVLAAEVGASAPPARPAILHPGAPGGPSTTIAARPSGGATRREAL